MWEVGRVGEELVTYPELGDPCLSSGKAEGNGKMYITLCDFIVPWDTLSTTQKKSLNHRYQMGCECKVSWHRLLPGFPSSPPPPGGLPGFIPGLPRPLTPQGPGLGRGQSLRVLVPAEP